MSPVLNPFTHVCLLMDNSHVKQWMSDIPFYAHKPLYVLLKYTGKCIFWTDTPACVFGNLNDFYTYRQIVFVSSVYLF